MKTLSWIATASLIGLATGTAFADTPSSNLPPVEWQTYGRAVLKQLIEIDSTHAHGSTGVAHAIEARLLAAGFPRKDVTFLAPSDHPTKGNVVVRLHGKGLAKPILYICHLDVVEADPKDWQTDPFKLVEKDGWLYGRGTIDMKGQDTETLTALIRLKKEGYVPDRDIIVAFTSDEEAGGDSNGVKWLLDTHRDLVDAAFAVNPDSGDPITKNGAKIYNLIQTAEKEYMTFAWEAQDKGGHSSRPTPANPIYHVAAAIERLSNFQFPVHLTDTSRKFFAVRAMREPGPLSADMKSLADGTADEAAIARLSKVIENNIMMRSTCVATQFNGGRSESALPTVARAIIQCRIIPGETQADVEKTLNGIANDPAVKLSVVYPPDISPETPLDPKVMDEVQKLTTEMWPGVLVAPEMSAGASDSAMTRAAGIPSFGIDGIFQDVDDSRAHGRDERVGIEAFNEGLEFSYRLMKALGQTK